MCQDLGRPSTGRCSAATSGPRWAPRVRLRQPRVASIRADMPLGARGFNHAAEAFAGPCADDERWPGAWLRQGLPVTRADGPVSRLAGFTSYASRAARPSGAPAGIPSHPVSGRGSVARPPATPSHQSSASAPRVRSAPSSRPCVIGQARLWTRAAPAYDPRLRGAGRSGRVPEPALEHDSPANQPLVRAQGSGPTGTTARRGADSSSM